MTPHLDRDSNVARNGRFAIPMIIPLMLLAAARADQPPAAGPAPPAVTTVPVYTLDDCLAIGRGNQPTLQAAAVQIPEQHRRAGSQKRKTTDVAGQGLRVGCDSVANPARDRSDGHDQKGDSEKGSDWRRGGAGGRPGFCVTGVL